MRIEISGPLENIARGYLEVRHEGNELVNAVVRRAVEEGMRQTGTKAFVVDGTQFTLVNGKLRTRSCNKHS